MDKSFTATLFAIGIAVLFLVLIIMTVMMIVSKIKHRGDDLFDDEDYDDDADGEVYVDEPYEESLDAAFETETYSERYEQQYDGSEEDEAAVSESDWEDEAEQIGEIPSITYDSTDEPTEEDDAYAPKADSAFAPEADSAFAPETDDTYDPETDSAFAPETDDTYDPETDSAFAPEMTGTQDDSFSPKAPDDMDSAFMVSTPPETDGAFADSAFAPETDSAFTDSAFAAETDSAFTDSAFAAETDSAFTDSAFAAADMTMPKKAGKKDTPSVVLRTDRFYWFNKTDVAAKPAYKTEEMYYHYFETPEECIEDLLTEMYDCALVRTEEIRYIAYGIEPVAVSMREILSVDKPHYILQEKRKEPSTQDLIKIYEKWCGYVEKLFGIIEFHADTYMVDQIHTLLCEFGKNDVDILITGM